MNCVPLWRMSLERDPNRAKKLLTGLKHLFVFSCVLFCVWLGTRGDKKFPHITCMCIIRERQIVWPSICRPFHTWQGPGNPKKMRPLCIACRLLHVHNKGSTDIVSLGLAGGHLCSQEALPPPQEIHPLQPPCPSATPHTNSPSLPTVWNALLCAVSYISYVRPSIQYCLRSLNFKPFW